MMSPHILLALTCIVPVAASAFPMPNEIPEPDEPNGTILTVTVGSDGACNYPNITQAALLSPAADILNIRVAKNVVIPGPQVIPRRDVAILGGYDNCSDSSPSGYTILDGTGFVGSVLWAVGDYSGSAIYTFRLTALDIRGGTGSASARGGGVTVDGPFRATLIDTRVQNNLTAFEGGGIYIKGQPGTATGTDRTSLYLQGNSVVINNDASEGGGIACTGRVRVETTDSQIAVNDAFARGGGISASGCYVVLRGHGLSQGIFGNRATTLGSQGGGVYASGGILWILGDHTRKSIVALNTAGNGGGIYVDSESLFAYDATINNNTALSTTGGGIYAVSSDTYVARTLAGANCHTSVRCSELSGNQVTGTGSGIGGGGIGAYFGNTLVLGTFVELNRVNSAHGLAISVYAAPGLTDPTREGLRIFGSVIAGNTANGQPVVSDASVVSIWGSSAALGWNTFSRNVEVPRIVYTPPIGVSSYPVNIYGSIFDATTGLAASPGASGSIPSGDCNRLHESTSTFALNSSRSTTSAPQFVDASNRDFRLAATSLLIDWCDASYNYGNAIGADGGLRPYDDPLWTALHGNYDIGALERQPVDLIFRDDFES